MSLEEKPIQSAIGDHLRQLRPGPVDLHDGYGQRTLDKSTVLPDVHSCGKPEVGIGLGHEHHQH